MPSIPPGSGNALRAAAAEHDAALAPCGPEHATRILMAMRSSTKITNEDVDESQASFAMLAGELAKLPRDILARACRDYVTTPGTRFFPKSPGEVMAYAGKRLLDRQRAAYRLAKMADEADRADAEQKRIAAQRGINPADVDESNKLMKSLGVKTRYGWDGSPYLLKPGDPDPVQAKEDDDGQ